MHHSRLLMMHKADQGLGRFLWCTILSAILCLTPSVPKSAETRHNSMAQYNQYAPISSVVQGDKFLVYQNATNALKTIDFTQMAASISGEIDLEFPYISVDTYGAAGDGITDDTLAIQSAIAAAGDNSVVVFSSGKTYVTTFQISVPGNNVTLLGYGSIVTSALETQYAKFAFTARNKGRVSGLTFDCGYVSGVFGLDPAVIDIEGSQDITIDNCTFVGVATAGVRVVGNTQRTTITNSRFFRCFIGVFSDDDAIAYQPTQNVITNCVFKDGLGGPSTPFSGAVKMSGFGSETSNAGHIVANNTIINAGQMGVEMQTWVNDSTISNNSIFGTGFGISISGCARVNITGNTLRNNVVYALESASGSRQVNWSNNVASSTVSGAEGIIIPDGTSDNSIVGCSFFGFEKSVHLQDGSNTVISGCLFYRPSIVGVEIQNGESVAITGCTFDGQGSYGFITLDSTNANVSKISIGNNLFIGTVTAGGINLYAPNAFTISDVSVVGNNTVGASAPAWMWNTSGTTVPENKLLRIRSVANFGPGTGAPQTSFNAEVYATAASMTYFYNYFYLEGGIINVNASGGARTIELPSSTGMIGYELTIRKTDAVANNVTVQGYSGQTIDGGTVVLGSQYDRVTVRSDGTNWIVVQSN